MKTTIQPKPLPAVYLLQSIGYRQNATVALEASFCQPHLPPPTSRGCCGNETGTCWGETLPQRVCSLGVPLAFRRNGQQTLVCVTPEGGVMASEWTLLEGRAQPSTKAGVANLGVQQSTVWAGTPQPSLPGLLTDILEGSSARREGSLFNSEPDFIIES